MAPEFSNFELYCNPDNVMDSFRIQCTNAHIYITGKRMDNAHHRLLIIDRLAPSPSPTTTATTRKLTLDDQTKYRTL